MMQQVFSVAGDPGAPPGLEDDAAATAAVAHDGEMPELGALGLTVRVLLAVLVAVLLVDAGNSGLHSLTGIAPLSSLIGSAKPSAPPPYPVAAPLHAVCIEDRGGARNIFHFIVLVIGGLVRHERPGGHVRLFLPWLFERELSFHTQMLALLPPDFDYQRGPVTDGAGCEAEWGAALWEDDRIEPDVHLFLRMLFRRIILRGADTARRPPPVFDPHSLIYLTRAPGGGRSIDNEQEYRSELEALGFRYIKLEDLTIADKLDLFAAARLVVSPQSAGLSFVPALDARASVVELYPYSNLRQYHHMCADLHIPFVRYTELDVTGGNSPWTISLRVRNSSHLVLFLAQRVTETQAVASGPPHPPVPKRSLAIESSRRLGVSSEVSSNGPPAALLQYSGGVSAPVSVWDAPAPFTEFATKR